jgi:transposase
VGTRCDLRSALTWSLVEDLYDPAVGRGIPARYARRSMVEAILSLARTGIQWRYLPDH